MADIVTYDTGTVEVAAGGTVVNGTGTFWSDWNARGGDELTIAGKGPVTIVDRLGPSQLKIRSWQHGALGPGAAYEVVPKALSRISGLDAFEDYMRVMRAMTEIGFIHNVPAGAVPNPSVGYEGQDAFDHLTGKGWRRATGVWNYRGKIAGLTFSQEPWSAAETYAAGIIVPRGVGLYKSLIDGNLNFPPESSPGQWAVYTPGSNVYTGSLLLPAGTTAAASYSFVGEPNTGVFKASAGHIGFAGQGALVGYIGTTGTVFYGPTHTMGSGGAGSSIALLNLNGGSGDTGGAHIRFTKNSDVKWYAGLDSSLAGGFSNDFSFYTASLIAVKLSHSTGQMTVAAAIASTSTTTGALVVPNGGLGVAGALNVGGPLVAASANFGSGDIYGKDLHLSRSATEGALFLDSSGTRYIYNDGTNISINGRPVTVTASVDSTSTTNGALVIPNGGLGVAGSGNFGGRVSIGGNVLSGKLGVQQGSGSAWTAVFQNVGNDSGASHGILIAGGPPGVASSNLLIGFYDAAFGNVGSVTRSGVSQVSYNIASDVRLKDKFDESGKDWGAVIDGLWVGDYVFKAEPDRLQFGVKAQQAFEHFPQGVTYDKHNDMWVADYSKFAPLALWGVKHARSEMRSFADRLAAIENRLSI